jgi:hypothetical protein
MDDALWWATSAIHDSGKSLMARILPEGEPAVKWEHYPPRDVVNGQWQARWYYHSHRDEIGTGPEHGHFHCFLGRGAFSSRTRPLISPPLRRRPRPSAVHIASLSIGFDGLPLAWTATNRWVTDEWMYPADAIIAKLPRISFVGNNGDPMVNQWLTAMLRASRGPVTRLLAERDDHLLRSDPAGEDRCIEIAAVAPIDIDDLLDI